MFHVRVVLNWGHWGVDWDEASKEGHLSRHAELKQPAHGTVSQKQFYGGVVREVGGKRPPLVDDTHGLGG